VPIAVDLAYDVTGAPDAPPVALAGSLGTTRAIWDRQLPALSGARVIRCDHRGHGASPAPPGPYTIEDLGCDLLQLLDRLKVARASVCGISLGGMVGMWLAANAPERVDRLVVICSSAHLPPASDWHARARAVLTAGDTGTIADAVLGRWLTPAFRATHRATADGLRRMLAGVPPAGYAACCAAIAAMDLRPRLGAIRAPTLVIAGAEDPATPPDHGSRIAAAIPDARLEIVQAAHLANVERPEAVSRLLADHLDLGGGK
jgi:3-oxoadipate enol-lactonase